MTRRRRSMGSHPWEPFAHDRGTTVPAGMVVIVVYQVAPEGSASAWGQPVRLRMVRSDRPRGFPIRCGSRGPPSGRRRSPFLEMRSGHHVSNNAFEAAFVRTAGAKGAVLRSGRPRSGLTCPPPASFAPGGVVPGVLLFVRLDRRLEAVALHVRSKFCNLRPRLIAFVTVRSCAAGSPRATVRPRGLASAGFAPRAL
jgi:hypothetical protein